MTKKTDLTRTAPVRHFEDSGACHVCGFCPDEKVGDYVMAAIVKSVVIVCYLQSLISLEPALEF